MKLKPLFLENVSEGQAVAKNVFWLVLGQAVNRSLNFIAVAYAARVLGATAFGAMTFAFAFTTLAFTFSDLGINLLVIREYGRAGSENRRGLLAALWHLKLACISGSAVIAAVLYLLVPTLVPPELFWLVLAVVSIDLVRDFFTSIARALERAAIESAVLIADGALTAVLGIAFLMRYGTVEGLVAGYALAGAIACVLSIVLVRRHRVPLFVHAAWGQVRALLRTVWPFAFGAVIALSFVQVDIVLLGWLRGAAEAGYYAPGSRIVQILFAFPMLVGAAILPALARGGTAARARITGRALSFVLMLSIPVAVGGALLARPLLGLLYGPAFLPGSGAFALLLIMFLAYACTLLLDHFLLSVNLQNRNFQYTAVAATGNLVLALILIPRWGIIGAAIATLAAQLLNLALTARLTNRTLGIPYIAWRETLDYLLAAAIMALFIAILPLPVWAIVPLSAIAYFAVLGALRTPLLNDGFRLIRD